MCLVNHQGGCMIISIVNRSKKIKDAQLQNVIRAINRQVSEDFSPYWSFAATLRLEGAVGKSPDKQSLADLRGDAILYLWDEADVVDALGYHQANFRGIPYGFVFTELCEQLGESWTVTLSHEALELIADPQANLLVQGPHPEDPSKEVFHWFEICDAVQSQTYQLDSVEVANFLLPLYFTVGEQEGGRNDFLGTQLQGRGIASFGVAPGGYIGFYDPALGGHTIYAGHADKKAQKRLAIKASAKFGRSYLRKRSNGINAKEAAHVQVLAPQPQLRRAAAAPLVPVADPIKHLVVLMLENHSFDQMLGDATRIYPTLEGIPQQGSKYANVSSKTGKQFVQAANPAGSVVKPDPGHELKEVKMQLGPVKKPMSGFIDSYLRSDGANESNAQQIMDYFPMGAAAAADSLPALHALARNFVICDHWFSSVPGPTWPNRFFAHTGTCLGHVLMPSREHPENLHRYNQDTIFDRLSSAKKNWRIYYDGIPQSAVLENLWSKLFTGHYEGMSDFYKDVKGPADKFPDYVFIEPRYFSPGENDQHPPSDIAPGDQLIAKVYNALRSNQALWESTLLIVLYDEHGGFYDHVTPPATIAPDTNTKEYSFDQLGVRVPAILVSPWLDPSLCKTVFDHSSILRYLCDKYAMPPLGKRTSSVAGPLQANSFSDLLNLRKTPRQDTPVKIQGRSSEKARRLATAESPVEGSREALLYFFATKSADKFPLQRAASAPKQKLAVKNISDTQLRAMAEIKFAEILDKKELSTN